MLSGKTVVFTGTLSCDREQAKAQAEAAGAKVTAAISGKTNILVAGPGAGAKVDAAKAKGIEIWTEDDFNAALGGAGAACSTGKAKAEAPAPKEPAAKKQKKAEAPPPPAPPAAPQGGGGSSAGARRVDREVPNAESYSVHDDYAVKLMQSNIGGGQNNNKFYIIQVIKGPGGFADWTRWGRLGERGQSNLGTFGSEAAAIKAFEKKFKDKTKNEWASRASFVKHSGKYQLVETDEADGDGAAGPDAALGKLSVSQIEKGQSVLAMLKAAIEGGGGDVGLLSSQFYSLIPTTSGRVAPPPIDNLGLLGAKESLLDFWLRMGFEDVKTLLGNPLAKLGEVPVPSSLEAAAAGISDKHSITSSLARGDTLAKAKAGSPAKAMDKHRYGCIVLYTGNTIYRALNKALREEHHVVPRYYPYLKLFFESAKCMRQSKVRLWRGIAADLYDEYEPGKVITWWSVSSCTSDESVARGFMKQLGGKATLLVLDCETALDIAPLSIYANEKESLLAPGVKLEVVKRSRSGTVAEIEVREVGSALDE